ncbi:DUF1534 domain-containing protein [Pseudomonas syringae]|nr:DUF1534 domain-containing protein [Pseudomonas syringae pv. tomato]MCF5222135.1 DUF1534 domain-containing protein [Pseudomonas syringae]MCF5241549.1 DUF1534 domain-containing protein [Pseudomonas syringae]PYD05416.1 hypothetical protein DND90_17290 [Pseudomonas syringae pv. maculicola]
MRNRPSLRMLQTRHLSFSRSSAFKIGRGASRTSLPRRAW